VAINERRLGAPRVQFERPLRAQLMAIDGTWRRDCLVVDISETGARIELTGPAAELIEFFLMLSTFGNPVFRRCKREWVDGTLIGVSFHKSPIGTKPLRQLRREAELV
jgi:PilZ domain